MPVALRKESVDRNQRKTPTQRRPMRSLSARRAWIEIALCRRCQPTKLVALRKESVDRNDGATAALAKLWRSLSARRAWIEIQFMPFI